MIKCWSHPALHVLATWYMFFLYYKTYFHLVCSFIERGCADKLLARQYPWYTLGRMTHPNFTAGATINNSYNEDRFQKYIIYRYLQYFNTTPFSFNTAPFSCRVYVLCIRFLVDNRDHLIGQAELTAHIWLCYSQRGGVLIVGGKLFELV